MPIAIDGKRYENDFEWTVDQAPSAGELSRETSENFGMWDKAVAGPDGKLIFYKANPLFDKDVDPGNIYQRQLVSPFEVTRNMRFTGNVDELPMSSNVDDRRAEVRNPPPMTNAQKIGFDPTPNLTDDEHVYDAMAMATNRLSGPYTHGLGKGAQFEVPITEPDNQPSEPLRITVTPKRPIEDKPMDEPFVDHQERRTVVDKLLGLTGDRYQLWPEKAARTLIDAFKLPGDVAQGKADPSSPESIGRAAELAGAVIFGPAPIAKAAVDGTLGSIAGISAKTVDKGMLEAAKVLDRRGYPNEEIYQTTGWFKGFDDKWKFELPSHSADLMPLTFKKGEAKNLPEVLHFPELYEAYPAFKEIKVIKHDYNKDAFAYYQHGPEPTIGLSSQFLASKDGGHQLDVLLHEVQHAIQHSEGFELARGDAKNQTKALYTAIQEKVKSLESPEEAVSFLRRATQLVDQARKQANSVRTSIGKALYGRDPGEAEATRVMDRRLWTPEQKAYESPVGTQLRLEKEGYAPSVIRFPYKEE